MNQYSETKINKILQDLPPNAVATTRWLGRYGVGSDLLHKYKKSHWFTTIGHGAVLRTGVKPSWAGAVYALQKQLKLPVHIGGKSAIGYQGHAHYLPLGKETVTLYCPYRTDIPKWFKGYDWQVNLKIKAISLFSADIVEGINKKEVQQFSLSISSLERAFLEILNDIPRQQTIDEAYKIMESLITLNPNRIQALLEKCNSIKVKRLFLFMAEKADHHWLKDLKIDQVRLGSGNQVIYKGGTLDKKYKITVPNNWENEEYDYMQDIGSNKMPDQIDEIIKDVFKAMNSACMDTVKFSGVFNERMRVEYLLTVKIAEAIMKERNAITSNFSLEFEKSRNQIIRDSCFDLVWSDNNKFKNKSKFFRNFSGSADLALYDHRKQAFPLGCPYCVIEVKGFNPTKPNIIKDFKRCVEYFSDEDSKLPYCLFVSLHSRKRCIDDAQSKKQVKQIQSLFENYLGEISDYQSKLYVETIQDIHPEVFEHIENDDPRENEHHFIGTVVLIQKKS